MTHFPEAHLSTLSHAIKRMSKESLAELLEDRRKMLLNVRQSTCLEDRVIANKGEVK